MVSHARKGYLRILSGGRAFRDRYTLGYAAREMTINHGNDHEICVLQPTASTLPFLRRVAGRDRTVLRGGWIMRWSSITLMQSGNISRYSSYILVSTAGDIINSS